MCRAERNPVNRKKLANSKWTAVYPENREKHFLVLDWVRDADGHPTDFVILEAILTSTVRRVHWRQLEDPEQWKIGWC